MTTTTTTTGPQLTLCSSIRIGGDSATKNKSTVGVSGSGGGGDINAAKSCTSSSRFTVGTTRSQSQSQHHGRHREKKIVFDLFLKSISIPASSSSSSTSVSTPTTGTESSASSNTGNKSQYLAISGTSGSGKSSLIESWSWWGVRGDDGDDGNNEGEEESDDGTCKNETSYAVGDDTQARTDNRNRSKSQSQSHPPSPSDCFFAVGNFDHGSGVRSPLHGTGGGSGGSAELLTSPGSASSNFYSSSRPFAAVAGALNDICEQWTSTPDGRQEAESFIEKLSTDKTMLVKYIPCLLQLQLQKEKDTTGNGAVEQQRSSSSSSNDDDDDDDDYNDLSTNKHKFERLRTVVLRLISCIASCQTPVILCMNDIHWADEQSLALIQFLVEENVEGLFIVSTHRSEYVEWIDDDDFDHDRHNDDDDNTNDMHQVNRFFKSLIKSKTTRSRFHRIHLSGFTLEEVNSIFAELVNKDKIDTLPLVEVIHEKTGGNPLFIEQFFKLLQQGGYLKFSFLSFQWEWNDVCEIRQAMSIVSTEVADVIADSMRTLDGQTLQVLKIASCLGSQIVVPILKEYLEKMELPSSTEDSKLDLDERINNDCTTKTDDILGQLVEMRFFKHSRGSTLYEWAHGKLQQAALSLLVEDEFYTTHLGLGKLILGQLRTNDALLSSVPREVLVYVGADQLNHIPFKMLLKEGNDLPVHLSSLNLQAARLSISKSAFYPAATLLRSGINLLIELASVRNDVSLWSGANYTLALDLYTLLSETCYTIGEHEEAKEAATTVLLNAKSNGDKYRSQLCLIEVATNGNDRDYTQGIELCTKFLRAYNIHVPAKPTQLGVLLERRRLNKCLPTGRLEDLLHIPDAKDKTSISVSAFLAKLSNFFALTGQRDLLAFTALRNFRHACKSGFTMYTTLSMAAYALYKRMIGDHKKAFTRSDLAMDLMKAHGVESTIIYARNILIVHSSCYALYKPLQDSLEPSLEAYRSGIAFGDVEVGLCSAMNYGYGYLFVGLPLSHLESDMASYGKECRLFGVSSSIQVQFPILQQSALNLMGITRSSLSNSAQDTSLTMLSGKAMDQTQALTTVKGNAQRMTFRDICTFRLLLASIFRDHSTAIEMIEKLSEFPLYSPLIGRMHTRAAFTGLASFNILRKRTLVKKLSSRTQKKIESAASDAFEYFKNEVEKGSLNAYPILTLLIAEKTPEKSLYDEAIRVCGRSGLKNFQAIANESCAMLFLKADEENPTSLTADDKDWASYYLGRSVHLFNEWQAFAKSSQLLQSYPELLNTSSLLADGRATGTSFRGKASHNDSVAAKTLTVVFDDDDVTGREDDD